MQNRNADQLDSMLDQALKAYGGGAPLAGLEQRVINRLNTAQRKRPGFRLMYPAFAIGLIAAILVAAIERRPDAIPVAVRTPTAPIVALSVEQPAHQPARKRSPKVRPVKSFSPKTELTGEERAMLTLARYQPAEPPTFAEPAEIEPIYIEPLKIETVPQN